MAESSGVSHVPPKRLSQPTLGLLVDWLEGDYQTELVRGVADAARERSVNLVCFTGGVLNSPLRGSLQRNHIYELAGPENVDGILVMSGALGSHVGKEELSSFCAAYGDIPLCSIAVRLPGVPSVLVDNDAGVREAVTHLIRDHGHREIAFIHGPEGNAESQRRLIVYRQVLEEYGIDYDESLVCPGDFQPAGGAKAVELLFGERGRTPRAIVSANDEMALGAIRALTSRGIRVPDQVAVLGFDDIEEARYSSPPLATVRQPLYEQGRQAVTTVLALLEGEPIAEEVVLHTELIKRRSCGCYSQITRELVLADKESARLSYEAALVQRRDLITAALARAARGAVAGPESQWENRLFNSFVGELRQERGRPFLDALDDILRSVVDTGGDVEAWQDVLSAFRTQVIPCLGYDDAARSKAEDILQQARVLTGSVIESAQARQRLRIERWARLLSEIGAELISTFDIDALRTAVRNYLPKLGIRSCYVCLYETPNQPAVCRLVLAYDEGTAEPELDDMMPYESKYLVPRKVLPAGRDYAYVVEPLFFREQELGFTLLELGPGEAMVYEALRDHFSAAVKGAQLVGKVSALRARSREATQQVGVQIAAAREALQQLSNAGAPPEHTSQLSDALDSLQSQFRLASDPPSH